MKYFEDYKPQILALISIFVLGFVVYALPIEAVKIMVDGQDVGYVASEDIVSQEVAIISEEANVNNNCDMILENVVSTEVVKVKRNEILEQEQIHSVLQSKLTYYTIGFEVKVNESPLYTFATKNDADLFLDKVITQFITEGATVKTSTFEEDITVEEIETSPETFLSVDSAWDSFVKGKDELETYTVQKGDTTWDLVQNFKMDIDEMEVYNPDIDIERLQIGQVINLNKPLAYINVVTVTTEMVEETIQSQIVYEKSDDLFVGENKLKTEGTNGTKQVELEVTYVNGILSNESVVAEEVVEQPTQTIILAGSKFREVAALGAFGNPANGVLTSRYGMRWGRKHSGIDIGAPKGTPIKVSADGIVVHVGNINGYGMTVKVDHGNGVQTLYGHASKYNVSLGQSVSKNDVIAYVGNTGRTTGYCLHFEVRVNGVPVDPLEYVNY